MEGALARTVPDPCECAPQQRTHSQYARCQREYTLLHAYVSQIYSRDGTMHEGKASCRYLATLVATLTETR